MTDYKPPPLNNFYAHFEAIGSQHAKTAEAEVNGWTNLPRAAFCGPCCTPCTHDCVATFDSNTIDKCADGTAVVGQITDNLPEEGGVRTTTSS